VSRWSVVVEYDPSALFLKWKFVVHEDGRLPLDVAYGAWSNFRLVGNASTPERARKTGERMIQKVLRQRRERAKRSDRARREYDVQP